jgi:hypothetical protein
MSNSATNLDLISASQAQKEATANALFDSASPAALYGRRASTTGGLVWGYYGGAVMVGGVPTQIANGTLTLAASATNYIEADPATGAVSSNTSGFTGGRTRLYLAATGTATVTSYTDLRVCVLGAGTSAQPFDLTAFYPGVLPASALVTRVPVARAVAFPAGLTGSIGKASVAATASAVFAVLKDGASVGTVTYAAGSATATFTAASAFTLAAGNVLSIVGPATPDTTLANVGIVLAGTR